MLIESEKLKKWIDKNVYATLNVHGEFVFEQELLNYIEKLENKNDNK